MKTDMDKQAALRAIFTGKSEQIGEVHVEERPAVIRWVFRCSKNGQPFDGRKFDAMLTVEDMPAFPGCIYVCNAMSAFAGGIRRMTLANRQFFIKRGYTHAYYKIDGVEHCRHLKTWRTEPVFDDAKDEISRIELSRATPCQD